MRRRPLVLHDGADRRRRSPRAAPRRAGARGRGRRRAHGAHGAHPRRRRPGAFSRCDPAKPKPSAPRSIAAVRDAFAQLARGLTALHAAGLSHLDVKPSNVLVDRAGRVVVVDFGLVRHVDASAAPHDGARSGSDPRSISGTPTWMAPEQYAGEGVGPASDAYALGLMLYAALTGVPAFAPASVPVMWLAKQTTQPTPPDALVRDVPADLSALALELLRADCAAAGRRRDRAAARGRRARRSVSPPRRPRRASSGGRRSARRSPQPSKPRASAPPSRTSSGPPASARRRSSTRSPTTPIEVRSCCADALTSARASPTRRSTRSSTPSPRTSPSATETRRSRGCRSTSRSSRACSPRSRRCRRSRRGCRRTRHRRACRSPRSAVVRRARCASSSRRSRRSGRSCCSSTTSTGPTATAPRCSPRCSRRPRRAGSSSARRCARSRRRRTATSLGTSRRRAR